MSLAMRQVSLAEVGKRIVVEDARRLPFIILSVSPCRSGTTALLRAFGAAGIPSFFQPLKNILRWLLLGGEAKWLLGADGKVYIKETLGPYTEAEATFDPLAVLLKAGVPLAKIHVLIVGREPYSTWSSWMAWWKGKTTLRIFALSYRTTERVREAAQRMGIPTTVMVYEALRDNEPQEVIRRLFKRLDVPYVPTAVTGWESLPGMGEPGSNVVWPEEPPGFITPGIHEMVKRSARLAYRVHPVSMIDRDMACREDMRRMGVPEVYERWRVACERDLGLRVGRMVG